MKKIFSRVALIVWLSSLVLIAAIIWISYSIQKELLVLQSIPIVVEAGLDNGAGKVHVLKLKEGATRVANILSQVLYAKSVLAEYQDYLPCRSVCRASEFGFGQDKVQWSEAVEFRNKRGLYSLDDSRYSAFMMVYANIVGEMFSPRVYELMKSAPAKPDFYFGMNLFYEIFKGLRNANPQVRGELLADRARAIDEYLKLNDKCVADLKLKEVYEVRCYDVFKK